ncbi:MAG: YceG family protein [Oscillospiraceae bacterium]|nr:YceG family protein [Oscillospiraceae bacterium]
MLNRVPLAHLEEYFSNLSDRKTKGVYFCRFAGCTPEVLEFMLRYHEAARLGGVIIEGRLQNPDDRNLAYFGEMMGMDFRHDKTFLTEKLHKWLPRMSPAQCENVAGAMFDTMTRLKSAGKNDNMLKNLYIKFMCWLYYRFERIVHQLGSEKLPKILFEGDITNYELLLLNVLCTAGCDVALLELHGDAGYLSFDPASAMSQLFMAPNMTAFPDGYCLKLIRQEIQERFRLEQLYGEEAAVKPCLNAWLSGKIFEDLRKAAMQRGKDSRFFYPMFCRVNGVEDKLSYENELFQLQMLLKGEKRHMLILSQTIPPPTPEELNRIPRKNYQKIDQLIADLSAFFRTVQNEDLRKLMHRSFVECMIGLSRKTPDHLNHICGLAVSLLCLIRRYQETLFGGWMYPAVSVFLYLGGCRTELEALFCQFLAGLPVDVVILVPDLNRRCCLTDSRLYELNYPETLAVEDYPDEQHGFRVGTAAYHAERELDSIMYEDSGMYRNRQYERENAVILRTMFEEIPILWEQEIKYRPNFSIVDNTVNMPVILSKICGVRDGDTRNYWQIVRSFVTEDTIVIPAVPKIRPTVVNPVKQYASAFLHGGKVQKDIIRSHKCYQYGILREATQETIFEKLQLLIDRRIIKGTLENGVEYDIVAGVLNLDKYSVRLIQKFDYTKHSPKIIYVVTKEDTLSVDDVIYFSFMSLMGFDILFFIPTGYQCFEQHLNQNFVEEHQIGEYQYELKPPGLSAFPPDKRQKLREKLFK